MSRNELGAKSEAVTPSAGSASDQPPRRTVGSRVLAGAGFVALIAAAVWYWLQPALWRASADKAIRARDLDQARQLLTRVVRRLPHDAASRLRLSQLLDLANQTDAAVEQLYRLPEDVLGREDVLINLGRMLTNLHRPAEAEKQLKLCIQKYPRAVRPRQLLLDLYRWQHRDEESQALRAELRELANNKPIADRLWVMLRSFIEEYSKIEDQENWEQLLRWWNQDKEDVVVRIAMARHLILANDRVQEAAADLEALLPFSPGNVAAIASLVEYYLNIEGRSLDRAEQLIREWPEQYRFHTYWRYHGQALERTTDEDGAVAAYRKALALRPDDLSSMQRLSALLVRVGRRSGDDSTVAEGVAMGERLTHATHVHARSTELANRTMQWLNDWDQATRGTGDVPDAAILSDLSDFYAQLGRDSESKQWWEIYEKLGSGITPAVRQ